ncbi:hypothetical protein [Natronoarchaeum sp. GCM10025703]|uniref:hypothetical protein n=1 Tax=Natronoarchaeum sp. GCM10025703 TaxID=3252685 RepID=UPI00367282C0
MSYNVRYDTPGDGDDVWDERRDAVADIVRSRRPALVGFQEPLPHQLTDLRERLPAYEIVGRGRNADGGGERSPIGFRRDRFSVLDRETLWLSETPENPGSVGWDAELPGSRPGFGFATNKLGGRSPTVTRISHTRVSEHGAKRRPCSLDDLTATIRRF